MVTTESRASLRQGPAVPEKPREVLLRVESLVKYFPVRAGLLQRVRAWVKAVDGVSFELHDGETLGLVGESGCGKTTVGRTILRLIPATSGKAYYRGIDLFGLPEGDLKRLRREMQIVFQDPFSSLDPRVPVGDSIAEGLLVHGMRDGAKRREIVQETLERVGLHPEHARRYPHEFSGGQRQRIGIARALALRPSFIICDEPVSALDVSVQSQVLNILKQLQRELGLSYIFIAHNLSVVEHVSDRVAVMYVGKMVELTDRAQLYSDPRHPYTKALLSAIPIPDPTLARKRIILTGDVPSPLNPPSGCRFYPRCPVVMEVCSKVEPPLLEVVPGHWAACHRVPPEPAMGAPSQPEGEAAGL